MGKEKGPHEIEFNELAGLVEPSRTADILRSGVKRGHMSWEAAKIVMQAVVEDKEFETQTIPVGRPILHLVGSEEVGSRYINYGNGDDAA